MPFQLPPISAIDIRTRAKIIKYFFAAFVIALTVFLSVNRVFDVYENTLLDLRFRLRPTQPCLEKIVIIEISDDTLKTLGYWPLPRDFHASLIDVLSFYGAKQVMFDIIFTDQSSHDEILADSIKKAGNVYLPFVVQLDNNALAKKKPLAKSIVAPVIASFKEAAKGVGHINPYRDRDGKTRWIPLYLDLNGQKYFHIALRMACDYLNIPFKKIAVLPHQINIDNQLNIPTSLEGAMLVNYAGKWKDTFRHFSYVDILAAWNDKLEGKKPRIDLTQLKDAVCFVGLTATGTADLQSMPLENNYPMVGLHANVINSILLKRFVRRADETVNLALLFILLTIVFVTTRKKKNKPAVAFATTVGYSLAFALLGFLLFFTKGVWVDIFCPVVLMLSLNAGMGIYQFLEENRRIELVEKELSIARKIQESFLPAAVENFQDLEIAARMIPAKHVGGDLYDMCPLSRSHLGVFIGDVSGKGVPAALVMAKSISLFRMLSLGSEEPSDLLFQLNEEMTRTANSGIFVTAAYVIYHASQKKVLLASAGHLATFLVRCKSKTVERIAPKEGMPLGLMGQVEFSQEDTTLGEGDKIVLYTDGVVEAKNLERKDYGEERLIQALQKTAQDNAQATLDVIQAEIKDFAGKAPQHDDCTLIILREKGQKG